MNFLDTARFCLTCIALIGAASCAPVGNGRNSNALEVSQLSQAESSETTGSLTHLNPNAVEDANVEGTLPPPAAPAFVVKASGFDKHAGEALFAVVLDANDKRMGDANLTVPSNGNFTLDFPTVVTVGDGYHLEYYTDVNKNGFCNVPPTDASWSVAIPSGSTSLDIASSDTYTEVCGAFGQFDLMFTGTDFVGHVGQMFYIDVTDKADGSIVGRVQSQKVPTGGKVLATWSGILLAGHAYTVAYFVDVNNDDMCNNGGQQAFGDHAWTNAVPAVTGDVSVAGSHDAPQVIKVCTNFPTGKL